MRLPRPRRTGCSTPRLRSNATGSCSTPNRKLGRLGEIRRAIAGEITDAGGVDAVRRALSRLFSAFVSTPRRTLATRVRGARNSSTGHDLMIELVVHERALEGYDERLLPVLRREPLVGNNQSVGSATR
jgi:hypothetical protein